jgi:hypothetical protein
MDTEHAPYFEIHPVKAYMLGRNGRGGIDIFNSAAEQAESGTERLHNGMVDASMAAVICGMAQQAEGEDPPVVTTRDAPTLLSHGLRTYYGAAASAPSLLVETRMIEHPTQRVGVRSSVPTHTRHKRVQ